ncbi:MAG: hypothetical protein IIB60_05370 [Planctomycetes bacterium]|nr:hypothetical protein [Planctomycetota bacterium]
MPVVLVITPVRIIFAIRQAKLDLPGGPVFAGAGCVTNGGEVRGVRTVSLDYVIFSPSRVIVRCIGRCTVSAIS